MKELKMIDDIIAERQAYKGGGVVALYSLFSGGHDSLVATWVASQHPMFSGVIHIDTGTGLPETRQFVEETCKEHGWPLLVEKPFLPYEALIMKHGFPGAVQHGFMYARLKDWPLRALIKKLKKKHNAGRFGKIILVSGVRRNESDRRAEIQDTPHMEGARIWAPIIVDWTATDCGQCMKDNGLRRSPVKDRLHISGECFCGAYKKRGEFQDVELWYPYMADRIRLWERLVQQARMNQQWEVEAGFREEVTIDAKHTTWGPSVAVPNDQMAMFPMCVMCRGDDDETGTDSSTAD